MTYAHEQLAADPHDRLGLRRGDDDWLRARWADPASRVLEVRGSRARPLDGRLVWTSPADAPDGLRLLLGEQDGAAWFAVVTEGRSARVEDGWLPLRGLLPALDDDVAVREAPLAFHALGMAEWLFATKFCPRCGGGLEPQKAGHELRCSRCGRSQFPRTDPAVIMVVTRGEPGAPDETCLLGRNAAWPEHRYSSLAGFCEPGESLEDAVRREVAEETGVVVGEVRYFGNQPWPMPASLMLGFHARAETETIEVDEHEIADARWFTREQMRAEAEAGSLVLPGGVSISRSLIEHWYGGPLPGQW
ncbi:NAD(+) diphosphatase [Nocardioides acrostichi]|uniref:NAD(+) diphosphatase n=1 Tax=Nocardioides acrostichi TaxID=2784339 RepID=A0A930Y9S9_9ACTN|nr:NAD(+) diphosphatase [Nocardioides acrostichi]MBF4160688.1 NAD(+) diphosphatase [Nocardioides acrostichi]